MMDLRSSSATRVALLALLSRVVVLGCMVFSKVAFSDLDTSARLQVRPCDGQQGGGQVQQAPLLPGAPAPPLSVWDIVHFVRIAKCGYETDMLAAFFPLVPAVMRLWSSVAGLLLPWEASAGVTVEHLLAFGGLATSLAAFCVAAVFLHRLSLRALRTPALANLSLLLFCLNPASVFYSAAYTEGIYAAASFAGLWLLPSHHWAAVVAFMVASAARSNGMLNCWFVVHNLLLSWRQKGRLALGSIVTAALSCLLIVAPYIGMQGLGYWTYCMSTAADVPEWCSRRIPSLYGYIQKQYWGVGFLQFYKDPARLPMIATALPVGYLSVRGCLEYFTADPLCLLTFGLYSSRKGTPLPRPLAPVSALLPAPRRQRAPQSQGFFSPAVAPYVCHWAALTAVALLVMNVHVATRFLSVCPPLYWYTAHYISAGGSSSGRRKAWVWSWIGAYAVLGCLLFPNYYPWT